MTCAGAIRPERYSTLEQRGDDRFHDEQSDVRRRTEIADARDPEQQKPFDGRL
jgi:hypothetical protein